jgi:hypothetical protein
MLGSEVPANVLAFGSRPTVAAWRVSSAGAGVGEMLRCGFVHPDNEAACPPAAMFTGFGGGFGYRFHLFTKPPRFTGLNGFGFNAAGGVNGFTS